MTDKRITDLAMDVLREGKEGREMELAFDVLMHHGEGALLRGIEVTRQCDPGAFILVKEPISDEVIRNARPGKVIAVTPDQKLVEENERLARVVRNIDVTCEEGGESELFFSHVAHFLRQDGFAQGPNMDEFFAGTNLEKRA